MSTSVDDAPITVLPGKPVPYRLDAGSGRAHLLLGEVGRVLAGAEESNGAISVMTLCGPAAPRPIPLHWHKAEHDYFYCVRGRMQVWADGHSRILSAGDVASVPPGSVHAYQLLDHYTEFLGPIVPSGWDRFFDFTGTPYAGSAYPQVDPTPPPFERFGAAEAKFDMAYVHDQPYAEATLGASDDELPPDQSPYFLRAGEGPRHTLFGQVCFQLLTGAQSGGRMAMTVTEGPKGPPTPAHTHERTYEAISCLDGRMRVFAGGETYELTRADFVSIPAGVEHSYAFDAHLTRFASMVAPAGIERFYELAGEVAEQRIFPPHAESPDPARFAAAAEALDIVPAA
jgi:quercetin 2,3-dioxygenase